MKAYKFLRNDMRSGSGDEPAWKIGEKRTIRGKLLICSRGYHSSPSFYDALGYAEGNMACIVEVTRPQHRQGDKYVSSSCTIISCKDAEKVLRTWACDCAERASKRAKVTDERSWNVIKVARFYNEGKATKEEWDAAWAAAWAAWDARSAAWDARSAAGAARAAAGAARSARGATWAAWAAEVKWQKKHLDKLMKTLFEGEPE